MIFFCVVAACAVIPVVYLVFEQWLYEKGFIKKSEK